MQYENIKNTSIGLNRYEIAILDILSNGYRYCCNSLQI